jgi:hypothetical protein
VREVGDRLTAGLDREIDRHGVDRLREGRDQAHVADGVAGIVARAPVADALRRAAHHRGWVVVGRHLEGGGIDEELEGGAWLAIGHDRAVELRLAVVDAADHGADGAVGLGHHHRRLLDVVGLALLADDRGHGLFGVGLQLRVDRRADNEAQPVDVGDKRLGLLKGPVEEVVG